MPLVTDVEREIGLAGLFILLIQIDDFGQQHFVHSDIAVGKLPIVIFHKIIILKAQIAVDVFPVVEPLEAGVTAFHSIALVPEIPGIGIGILPEILELAEARQKTALRIDGAAGKDIGDQIAGNSFLLQLVVFLIDV